MNKNLAEHIIAEASRLGVVEFCVCPGGRNAPFIPLLTQKHIRNYFWFEERSAAFFAIGRARITERPVGVIVTSGTASGELLPAAMEAYYSGVPLLLITADRPKRFRGSGAPQTAEQVGLFGQYATFSLDLAEDDRCDLYGWDVASPAHVNVCFEEPLL
jgi:2-succinyl-5-enolpyruvyl-6-hydroxy-3-cyclohexene-1-carboxylate synthase